MTTSRNPLVSILTPTYNHSAYIGSCIESVLAQSYSNWEQIVIDDGSTDDTRAVIARFRDSRIRYLRQENQGIFQIAGTYNRALSLSRGSLIAPLEGDDFWPRDRLAVSVPAFDDPAVVISHGLCRSITPPGIPCATEISAPAMQSSHRATLFNDPVGAACSAMLQFGSVLTTALGNSWPATACCDFQTAPSLGSHVNCLRDNPMTTALIRRSALEAIGGFRQVPGLPVMDYPTLVELALQGKFFFFNQVMCHWRMHGGNSSERYRDDITCGFYRYAMDFVDRHRDDPRLAGISPAAMEAEWKRRMGKRALWNGRQLLVRRRPREARAFLKTALRSPGLDIRGAAAFGVAASYAGLSIEPLVQMAKWGAAFLDLALPLRRARVL